jgi:hypothetical protein
MSSLLRIASGKENVHDPGMSDEEIEEIKDEQKQFPSSFRRQS